MTVTKPSCILQRTTIVINIYRVMKRYVRMSRIMSRAPPICSTNYKSDVSRQMITDIERDVISGRTSRSLSLSLSPRWIRSNRVRCASMNRGYENIIFLPLRVRGRRLHFSSTRPPSVSVRFQRRKKFKKIGRSSFHRSGIDWWSDKKRREIRMEWKRPFSLHRLVENLSLYQNRIKL